MERVSALKSVYAKPSVFAACNWCWNNIKEAEKGEEVSDTYCVGE
jgi:hypothetical protein